MLNYFLLIYEVSNGPGTMIPIVYSSKILKICKLNSTKIIYIESFCRVQKLSLTGKLVYPIADKFIVMWEELTKKYKKAIYLGKILWYSILDYWF